MNNNESNIRVFISFSDDDRVLAKSIQKALEKRSRLVVFLDEHIPTGGKWESVIRQEIQQSDVFLALLSNRYLESHHCYNIEATDAYKSYLVSPHGTPEFFPVVLEQLAPIIYEKTCFSEFQFFPRNNTYFRHLSDASEKAEFVQNLLVEFDKFINASLSILKHSSHQISVVEPTVLGPLAHRELQEPQGVFEAYDPYLKALFSIDPALSEQQALTSMLDKIVAQMNADCAYIQSEGNENATVTFVRSEKGQLSLSAFLVHAQLNRKVEQLHQLKKSVYLKQFLATLEPKRQDVLVIPVKSCDGALLVITGDN